MWMLYSLEWFHSWRLDLGQNNVQIWRWSWIPAPFGVLNKVKQIVSMISAFFTGHGQLTSDKNNKEYRASSEHIRPNRRPADPYRGRFKVEVHRVLCQYGRTRRLFYRTQCLIKSWNLTAVVSAIQHDSVSTRWVCSIHTALESLKSSLSALSIW